MKTNSLALLSFFSLLSGGLARSRGRFTTSDKSDPIDQKSRVTAFVNTDEGLKVECWEIGDFLPDDQVAPANGLGGKVRRTTLLGNIEITLFSFAPSVTLFSFGATEVHENAIDFRARPNLFTVKDGLIYIEANAVTDGASANNEGPSTYVFADLNGDDWFYFEDSTSSSMQDEQCAKSTAKSHFNARTISGSDTTLINFQYDSTPKHRVLHEGRCNFAGLKPVAETKQSDYDSGKTRFREQL